MKTKLKELRKTNNLSMDKLGKEINMSSGEISDIENGKKKDPILITTIKRKVYKSLINLKHQQDQSQLFLMRMKEMKRLIFQLIKLYRQDISVPLKTH